MGSTGTGSFTDYPGSSKGKGKGGGSGGGGGETPDRCARAFSSSLEDVEHSEYFKNHKAVPKAGTELRVAKKKRLVAETKKGEVVGNLPTRLNYISGCLEEGYAYVGTVRDSAAGSVAAVTVDFAPVPPK
jgi:hypothetical protein